MSGHNVERCYKLHPPSKRKTAGFSKIHKPVEPDGMVVAAVETDDAVVNTIGMNPNSSVVELEAAIDINSNLKGNIMIDDSLININPTRIEDQRIDSLNDVLTKDWQVQRSNHSQFIHIQFYIGAQVGYATFIYASCLASNQATLWNELILIGKAINSFWILGGDLNCLSPLGERKCGRPPTISALNKFNDFLSEAELFDLGYQGPDFTWRRGAMWERLDRLLGNSKWVQTFPCTIITHLAMFVDEVGKVWRAEGNSNPWVKLWILQKKVVAHLKKWNWEKFDNINENLTTAQSNVIKMEKNFQMGLNSEAELHKASEELLMHTNFTEGFLKKKNAVTRFIDGDRNINFRRKNNIILSMHDSNGNVVTDAEDIATDAVQYFQKIFMDQFTERAPIKVELFSEFINYAQSLDLIQIPMEGEIKAALDSIDDQKVAGPDGFTTKLYKSTWHIISGEVVDVVQCFFKGMNPPKYFTTSTITLIPKNSTRTGWGDFRPISLTNVLSKVISKVINSRLQPHLQQLISNNQVAFVKGRQISDNILLAQELLLDLDRKIRGSNLILKLDIQKAYDTINWNFILDTLIARGFSEPFIILIKRWFCINNHFILINGKSHGFFSASRGIKQGDPLSPTIFILAMDYHSRLLNQLFASSPHMTYQHRSNIGVSHLSYANDIIIFSKATKTAVKALFQGLTHFQITSGMHLNKHKC
ncbi:uncharacterized protein LOC110028576 [Phalaenopsis equestris]|uniref:uncharacterized protein LOC110028576 n=1 Tax=Phalaenopsis equestris TaxID=78828 RepID=UPI0009E1C8A4|nr:uncharacterized protein LOC110028576 [Phalaenopsis equestris]